MKQYTMLIVVAVLHQGCGGSVDDEQPASPSPGVSDAGAGPELAHRADAGKPRERVIPLCEGAHEPAPEDCQELVYGAHGYCNRWVPCDSL
jgi:hypothetical protein